MSKSNLYRALEALLGLGWYPIDRNQIKGEVIHSVTGDVTSSSRPDEFWARRSTPRVGGFDIIRRCKAQHGCYPEDIEEEGLAPVLAPRCEYGDIRVDDPWLAIGD